MNEIESNSNIFETFYVSDLELRLEAISHKIFPKIPISPIAQPKFNRFNPTSGTKEIKKLMESLKNSKFHLPDHYSSSLSSSSSSSSRSSSPHTPPLDKRIKSSLLSASDGAAHIKKKSPKTIKSIRFADELGLELTRIKYIGDPDTPPCIPKKLLTRCQRQNNTNVLFTKKRTDLTGYASFIQNFNKKIHSSCSSSSSSSSDDDDDNDDDNNNIDSNYQDTNYFTSQVINESTHCDLVKVKSPSFKIGNLNFSWSKDFEQPCLSPHFNRRLSEREMLLESIHAKNASIDGIIRVLNKNFHKQVTVRYTLNNWKTFDDLKCDYVEEPVPLNNSIAGHCFDRFKFNLKLENEFILSVVDQNQQNNKDPFFSFKFAICYKSMPVSSSSSSTSSSSSISQINFDQVPGIWDNNDGKDYEIKCDFKLFS